MQQPITLHTDAHTMGAIDLRSGRAPCHGLPRYEQESYDAGYRRALRLACQRPDAADILPDHFHL